jgi:hypothetical protein
MCTCPRGVVADRGGRIQVEFEQIARHLPISVVAT